MAENYENWSDVYFGYFALKSLVKTTQPWNVWHHIGEMIKGQKHVHVNDDNFVIKFCSTILCIRIIDIVFAYLQSV